MFTLEQLAIAYPKHLWLEISPEAEQLPNYSNDVARKNGYINSLCLNTFVKWLQQEPDLQSAILVAPSRNALPSIWEVVNGAAIECDGTRIVLIPSEIGDIDELSVPQEWVDIPTWAGDYYLAVQVNVEDNECWMRVWGFATHQMLKAGEYNAVKRTYCVSGEDLIESLNAMWVAVKVCPETKPIVEPLANLSSVQAEKLLEQLGKPTLYSPRLEVEFEQWAALVENEEWRQKLWLQRSVSLPPLSQWFETNRQEVVEAIKAAGWQLYEEVFGTAKVDFAFNFRHYSTENKNSVVREIELETQSGNYAIALVINIMRDADGNVFILPQLRPIGSVDRTICLPEGIELLVLDESGEIFYRVRAGSASNLIQLDDYISDEPGARFSVKIVLGETSITKNLAF